ncbi:MAG: hypothetical protein Q9225_005206 [Loekoesia sp. 1 TL-2023]
MFPADLVYVSVGGTQLVGKETERPQGYYTKYKANYKLDVVVVEASAITEEGGIIPGASVGASPELIQMADKIIVEVNTAIPSFEALHDITRPDLPPRRKPYLTANLIEFLKHEVSKGRLPENLLPIQSGIEHVANAIIGGLAHGNNFDKLKVWTEVLQDSFLDLFDSGHLDFATAISIRFSPDGFKRFYGGWENYAGKLLLRSQQVSNSPEIIRRLGVIGMNTAVEV